MENIYLNPSVRFYLTNIFLPPPFSLFCCHRWHQAKEKEEMVSYRVVSLGQVRELKCAWNVTLTLSKLLK